MDYQNGKIYSIRSHQTNDVYYGSTTQPLYKRLSKHKNDFKQWNNNTSHYLTSFEIIKYDDCYIELVENFPCNSKDELHKREGEIIRANECVNKNIAGRTKKEYYENNKETIIEKKKKYREENQEAIKEKNKIYYEDNKEIINEKKKIYYENNKEIINEKRREKFKCECGGCYTLCNKSIHSKTNKHQQYLQNA